MTRKKSPGTPQRLRTARGRKLSSARWLQRQINDPYVAKAKAQGYASRAAFKLIELDQRFHFLASGKRIVDLGAAPGGWTRVAMEKVGRRGRVVAIDLSKMDPVPGAHVLCHDFLDEDAPGLIAEALQGPADVVLSDMASPATGHAGTDHVRIMALAEAALDFACTILAPGGAFIAKVYQGGTEHQLLAAIKRRFKTVKHAKPPASRAQSAETYLVALGFRG
jgi:23S rRNA (uridine2552-2'-O)-methyltransferase